MLQQHKPSQRMSIGMNYYEGDVAENPQKAADFCNKHGLTQVDII